ncbi:hypothetical protein U1Q18_039873 [Sarracenia purpurea var. burkii]
MGCCFSKKTTICSTPSALPDPPDQSKTSPQVAEKKKAEEETVKKEIFLIKHRKSHDTDRRTEEEKSESDRKEATSASEAADAGSKTTGASNNVSSGGFPNGGGIVVRTSSCTKEEVDAILIQCGRLSRSSSTGKVAAAALPGGGTCDNKTDRSRKYSGSKRSYDFDRENSTEKCNAVEDENYDEEVTAAGDGDDGETLAERIHRYRERQRQSRPSSSSGRRRTPSREREQQQRSGSRERGGSGGGRRVSRSPGRRSESPITGSIASSTNVNNGSNACNGSSGRPGKMISVPATVSTLAMEKSNNGGEAEPPPSAAVIKRVSVKRNAGGDGAAMSGRGTASPRSRSPARTNVKTASENQNQHQQQQPLSLSRSNSRKADQSSPYRRNPLGEIDQNCVGFEAPHQGNKAPNFILSQAPIQKPNTENVKSKKGVMQGTDNGKTNSGKGTLDNKAGTSRGKEHQPVEDEGKAFPTMTTNVALTAVAALGAEGLKPPQTITRSRSSRLSRDLDHLNPDTPPPSSYTALLLEDIQNFHQMNTTTPAISLPPCVTKACSILEAVADLNSSTRSTAEQFSKKEDIFSFGTNPVGKKRLESKKDPFLESEVTVRNDLTEPSFHKYVTVSRGAAGGVDMEEQESSGSNSVVGGGQQHWVSSSSSTWEPNSADSVDCRTSSRLNTTRGEDKSPLGFQRRAFSEPNR